jgi:hypothetical protein
MVERDKSLLFHLICYIELRRGYTVERLKRSLSKGMIAFIHNAFEDVIRLFRKLRADSMTSARDEEILRVRKSLMKFDASERVDELVEVTGEDEDFSGLEFTGDPGQRGCRTGMTERRTQLAYNSTRRLLPSLPYSLD